MKKPASTRRAPVKPSFQRAWDRDDEWSDKAMESAARAMAGWLKGSVNVKRSINTLSLSEMKGMAAAAVHEWIVQASHRVHDDPAAPAELKTILG